MSKSNTRCKIEYKFKNHDYDSFEDYAEDHC